MILVALGANIPSPVGAPRVTLAHALDAMVAENIRVAQLSAFYSTPAWPNPADPPFVNAVAAVETALQPSTLLTLLHEIERQFGRTRERTNAPRTLDIDLLDYGGRIDNEWPVLPHPRICSRAFVLVPLAEIVPKWRHPVTGVIVGDLLEALPLEEIRSVIALQA